VRDLHFGGLLSFAFGGTLLLFLLIDINDVVIGHSNTFTWNSWLYPEAAILGFIAFLLIGYGLFVNIKKSKVEK
jgi:hypothetical protein